MTQQNLLNMPFLLLYFCLISFQFDPFLKIMNFASNDNPNTEQASSVFLKNLLHKDTKPLLGLDDAISQRTTDNDCFEFHEGF